MYLVDDDDFLEKVMRDDFEVKDIIGTKDPLPVIIEV